MVIFMENTKTPNRSDIVIQWFKSETFWQSVAAGTLSTGALSIGALIVATVLGAVELLALVASVLGFVLVACAAWLYIASHSTLGKQRAKLKEVLSNNQSGISLHGAWLGVITSGIGLIVIAISQLPLLG